MTDASVESFDPGSARRNAAGLRGYLRLATLWSLTEEEERCLLGDPPRAVFDAWKAGESVELSDDALYRISYLLGIFKALEILLPLPQRADTWVRQPNSSPMFGGRSPLEAMLSGDIADLARVRQHLDAQCDGGVGCD